MKIGDRVKILNVHYVGGGRGEEKYIGNVGTIIGKEDYWCDEFDWRVNMDFFKTKEENKGFATFELKLLNVQLDFAFEESNENR